MKTRFVLIAALLVSSSAYGAEAPKPRPQQAVQGQGAPAKVMLASANQVRGAPAGVEDASTVTKRPRGRVTTCRCGGQLEEPAEDQE
jgi:hypothetical protein